VSNDRNYSYLGVRGFSRPSDYNNRVLLLVDGHGINENLYGSTTLGSGFGLDLSAIDRIEIVRGPGSALYGTGAMFAVVNVVTKSADMIDGVEVSGGAGTFGSKRGTAMAGATFDNGVKLVVSGQWRDASGEDLFFPEFNDPATNNGMAVGLDWDRSYGGHISLDMGDFTFRAAHTSREKGIPTGAWEIDFNDPEAQTHDEWSFAELSYIATCTTGPTRTKMMGEPGTTRTPASGSAQSHCFAGTRQVPTASCSVGRPG
jgi:iron complex outermembrane receptor protein